MSDKFFTIPIERLYQLIENSRHGIKRIAQGPAYRPAEIACLNNEAVSPLGQIVIQSERVFPIKGYIIAVIRMISIIIHDTRQHQAIGQGHDLKINTIDIIETILIRALHRKNIAFIYTSKNCIGNN